MSNGVLVIVLGLAFACELLVHAYVVPEICMRGLELVERVRGSFVVFLLCSQSFFTK